MPSLTQKIEKAKNTALQALYYGYIPLIFTLGLLSLKQQISNA